MSTKFLGKTYKVDLIRKNYAKAYEPWTEEEDAMLKKAYDEFLKFKDALGQTDEIFFADYGQRHGRQPGSIRSRIGKLLDGTIPPYRETKKKTSSDVLTAIEPKQLDLNPAFQEAYD